MVKKIDVGKKSVSSYKMKANYIAIIVLLRRKLRPYMFTAYFIFNTYHSLLAWWLDICFLCLFCLPEIIIMRGYKIQWEEWSYTACSGIFHRKQCMWQ